MKNNSRILKCATVALVVIVALTLVFSSCGKNKRANGNQQELALFDSLRIVAWDSRSMDILPVIDSLQEAGELSDLRADFLRGITYDRSRHIKVGESYYKKLYETVDPMKDGWPFYLEIANRLSQLRMTTGDSKGSIAVATEALDRAEKAGTLTDDNKSGFLWSIAACQDQLGMKEAEQTSLQVYELLEKLANERGMKVDRNLLVYSYNIAQRHLNNKNFDKAEEWVKRTESMLKEFTQPEDSAFVKEYAGAIAMARVYLLEGQDKGDLAYSFFRKTLPTIANTPESIHLAASYLTEKGQYAEAANLYNHLDEILPADSKESEINLENIAWNTIPRLTANIKAGRTDTVISIARYIADNYVQSFIKDRESKATELATIYDTQGKERQIAEQQASMSKQRSVAMLIVLVLLTTFFIIYTWYRRRAENRLGEAHTKLQKAYNQLEETTAAKERIESELRIARDIQMSMVPGIFPEYKGLDMYATMTPAKEVGGDLYGYVMQGDMLYFCVGDVSGKGVPASLFMAQSARLFRTLAAENMMPADIAFRMNNALAENNDRGMFVTMFIGLLHLDTGHLDYCNCGHNAPVIDGQFLKMEYVNQPLGLWEDDPFEGESIDDIRGRQMLIYTDGLNEAENKEKELLGNKRLLELMADTHSLDSHQVIDMLVESVEQHRSGADPNDDLTLMCLKYQ